MITLAKFNCLVKFNFLVCQFHLNVKSHAGNTNEERYPLKMIHGLLKRKIVVPTMIFDRQPVLGVGKLIYCVPILI